MKYGYARVSTDDQNLDLQLNALNTAGCERIFADKGVSGGSVTRPSLDELLALVEQGDHVVVWRLDRLGRSVPHLIETVTKLGHTDVEFISLTENIDTSSASGKLVFHIFAALAEFERSLLSERTKAGLVAARSRGVQLGRPKKLSDARITHAKQLLADGKTRREVCHLLRVSPATLWRHVTSSTSRRKS